MEKEPIMVVDDEENMRHILSELLTRNGYHVYDVGNGHDALKITRKHSISLVISDLIMPGMSGLQLLAELKKMCPDLPVIIVTAYGTVDTAVEAMKKGAYDYVLKPFDNNEILFTTKKALLSSKGNTGKMRRVPGKLLVGSSRKISMIYDKIEKIAASSANVLVIGETGTGKELVAREIHSRSTRSKGPFICVNCAALPDTLLESELFGYEKGAFTGAINQKPGRFEVADGGTIFLDEIGDTSPLMQTKLLRVLEDKRIARLGGNKERLVNVRIIAATNKNLKQACKENAFRQDLYYRINVLNINLPPLRDHTEDIPEMANHFITYYCKKDNHPAKTLENDALTTLMVYDWPGNIRELENIIARAVAMSSSNTILPADIDLPVKQTTDVQKNNLKDTLRMATAHVEKEAIIKVLKENNGNRTKAAKALNISRRNLINKIKLYHLEDVK